MISINVFSEEKAWSKRLKNKDIFFKKICKAFPKKYKFLNKKVTLTLLLSNNKNIKKLNKVFRKKNKSTDILSFPLDKKIKISKNTYLGDVYKRQGLKIKIFFLKKYVKLFQKNINF